MKYVIDTNILIHIVRSSPTWEYVDMTFEPFDFPKNETYVSFASVAEILAISLKLGWKEKKIIKLSEFLSKLEIINTSGNIDDKLLQNYAIIDAYSQGKLENLPLPKGMSARNMGKNDIWIAATASAIEASLLTTDKDFLHLDNVFCKVILVE
ncbi:type II toxin-antitoxin system VapC family toxin [Bernardetia sp.]|uniref:type II toxin-antitoxin system VapC family toxin n=1 Tax=Bernardetia sp. TaxID=1937974 RepID=UPI0025BE7F2B|nr:type II toxin-antitoxin system VapC family toxin [Bernardetia sp.]